MAQDYSRFHVLIDEAATSPQLGFVDYASALADIISSSTPEFAIGIFGSWGTGKTTLMRQIETVLGGDDRVVTAWFTAWRYEKETHLIVPLVDVLREALDQRATVEGDQGPARRAAGALRRAGRAFLAGLTLSGKLPGVEVQLDPGKIMEELATKPETGNEALSFYHAAFVMLREAIEDFSEQGARRVVVFVDDLDRCFPSNALDVLESMKLFFDVQGCVFVVGLDQAVAERAVAQKYSVTEPATTSQVAISGVDYLKKIFQVPFALPRVGTDQLRDYCWSMMRAASLDASQISDFEDNVAPHLAFLPDQDSVNPREIKRLINAYVLQVKMLQLRLGDRLNPNIVLALQLMNFRPDWREFYDELAADPLLFQRILRDAVASPEPEEQVWLAGRQMPIPNQLTQYLQGLGQALLDDPQLGSYVSAAESSRSSDPYLLEAQSTLNRLRRAIDALSKDASLERAHELPVEVSRLSELGHRRSDQPRLSRAVAELSTLTKDVFGPRADEPEDEASRKRARLEELVSSVEAELRELRRQSNLGAYS